MWTSLILLAAALAQPFAPPPPGPPAAAPAAPAQGMPVPGEHAEAIEVVAVEARQTGTPRLDPSLQPLKKLLDGLPFDTFDLVFQNEKQVYLGGTGVYPVTDAYTVHVMLGPQLSQQEVSLEVMVELNDGTRRLNALRASGQVPRGRALVFRGLELPEGELVVLLTVKQPQDDQSQDQQQQSAQSQQEQQQQQQQDQQEQEPEEDQDSQQQEEQEQEQLAQQEQEEPRQEMEEQEQDEVNPDELQNIEALLESLREQDRREQKDAQNRRQRVIVSGDWW